MSDSLSIAPKERINITYKPATGSQQEQVELPFKMLVIADLKGSEGTDSLEDRQVYDINQGSLDGLVAELAPTLNLKVKDKLGSDPTVDVDFNLSFKTMKDFHPDNISRNFPALSQLMELRDALKALRGPLGNVSEFRRKLDAIVHDDTSRAALLKELNITPAAATAEAAKPTDTKAK
jgi:type VI secretion system protein ImpB